MQYNFGQRGQTNGKAGKQAAVPSWAEAAKKSGCQVLEIRYIGQ